MNVGYCHYLHTHYMLFEDLSGVTKINAADAEIDNETALNRKTVEANEIQQHMLQLSSVIKCFHSLHKAHLMSSSVLQTHPL